MLIVETYMYMYVKVENDWEKLYSISYPHSF